MAIRNGATIWARQTIESNIFYYKPDKWFKIWFYIVNQVNHKDTKLFKRGEGLIKYTDIMASTKATKKQTENCIKWLKKESMLESKRTTRGMIRIVLNYAKYQELNNYKESGKESGKESRGRVEGELEGVPIDKNDKNVKNDILPANADEQDIVKILSNDKQRHIRVIGIYWYKQGFKPTKKTYQSSLRRDLIAAKALVGYEDKDIASVMDWLNAKVDYKWTLETVHKHIDNYISEK